MKETAYTKMIMDETYPKIYEDDNIVAMLDPKPAATGHVIVVPRESHPIIELTPDEVLAKMFHVANKISTAMFEELGCTGTNLLISNGIPAGQAIPHLALNVIPRKEGDGIGLTWETKQLSEEEMSAVEMKMKEQTDEVGKEQDAPAMPVQTQEPSAPTPEKPSEPEEDNRLDRLDRIP